MNTPAEHAARWGPLGRAILDFHRGAAAARIVVHSNLWEDEVTPVEEFYRPDHLKLQELEIRALSLCRGRVLDLGAGAGRHALELQRLGHDVTAVDVAPEAVEVMRERGVRDARCGALDAVTGEVYDTIILLMHGIGLVGTLAGLGAFFKHIDPHLADGGRIVCDSADLSLAMPSQCESQNNRRGDTARFLGEVEFRLSYDGIEGIPYPWLFVDPETLGRVADRAGFDCRVAARGARGAFLASLARR